MKLKLIHYECWLEATEEQAAKIERQGILGHYWVSLVALKSRDRMRLKIQREQVTVEDATKRRTRKGGDA